MNVKFLWIAGAAVLIIAASAALIAYICFRIAFYSPDRPSVPSQEFELPQGRIYEPYRDKMLGWMKQTRAMPHENFEIISFDGLILRGKYYEYTPGAPIELMFHGYRGTAERDLCGGVQRAFKLGRSALIVDQRAASRSEGNVISFGINESRDCISWVHFMIGHFGPDVRIILTGMSMGASTVLTAPAWGLPENVIGILADCGFSSPRKIIQKVIRQMGFPVGLAYPFVRLGARLYGHFDLEEITPVQALEKCTLPVIFFHGESDDFVPWEMSLENYNACQGPKRLVTIPGAGHGLSYPVAPQKYVEELADFFGAAASTPAG